MWRLHHESTDTARSQIFADQVGLTCLALTDLLPLAATGHDAVQPIYRHLKDEYPYTVLIIKNRRSDKGSLVTIGWTIGLKIDDADIVRFFRLHG